MAESGCNAVSVLDIVILFVGVAICFIIVPVCMNIGEKLSDMLGDWAERWF